MKRCLYLIKLCRIQTHEKLLISQRFFTSAQIVTQVSREKLFISHGVERFFKYVQFKVVTHISQCNEKLFISPLKRGVERFFYLSFLFIHIVELASHLAILSDMIVLPSSSMRNNPRWATVGMEAVRCSAN